MIDILEAVDLSTASVCYAPEQRLQGHGSAQ